MRPIRYIILFLCCLAAVQSQAQIQINKLITVEFYDPVLAEHSEHTVWFKLFNVEADGTIVASSLSVPADPKANLDQDAKHIAASKNATDTIILTVDKRLASIDGGKFQYRVMLDGKMLLDWRPIDFSENNKVSGNDYMLVKGLSRDHKYVIDVKTTAGKSLGEVVSFDYPTPVILGVFFPNQRDGLYQATKYGTADSFSCDTMPEVFWQGYGYTGGFDAIDATGSFARHQLSAQDLAAKNMDSLRKHAYIVPSELNVPDDYNDILFLMGPIADTQSYKYCLVNDKNPNDTVLSWRENHAGNAIIELKRLEAGQYRLYVRYNYHDSHSCVYYFTLRSHNLLSFSIGFLVGMSIILLPVLTFKYVKKQKRKNKEMQHKMTALQLQSYRAQLNPHFIFNALSSIQSLVNRDDKEQANKYLIDFSTLLRATLDRQSEFWTLQDETDLLQKYIRLEQLRFRFSFEIDINRSISTDTIDFPSMLLQPVVENAIKHGISARHEEGRLHIDIQAKEDDLIVTVTDNGKGFDTENIKENSKGLALTKDRIALLNEQNEERSIKLDIKSNAQGTTVTFYLYHYLLQG